MKKVILLFVCYCWLESASAQTTVHLSGGLNYSSGSSSFSSSYIGGQASARYAPRIGLTLEHGFHDQFGLQTGLFYAGKGFRLDFEQLRDGIGTGNAKFAINYVELPLMAYYKNNRFQLLLGAYFAYAVNGRSTTVFEYLDAGSMQKFVSEQFLLFGDKNTEEDDLLIPMRFRRSDFGLIAGVTYQLSNTATISLLYSKGLTNVIVDDQDMSDPILQNTAFNLSISFALNKLIH